MERKTCSEKDFSFIAWKALIVEQKRQKNEWDFQKIAPLFEKPLQYQRTRLLFENYNSIDERTSCKIESQRVDIL